MSIAVTIETIQLEEIQDLRWPTDRDLVASFRKTLQHGGQLPPLQINRVWRADATWHYEIVDGFHRYEAAKAEHLQALICQVVELDDRAARYARIQACLGKPSQVTQERALLELQQAFVSDMQALIGTPEVIYEPILGEDGQVQARRRTAPLPAEPLRALEALMDHLRATRAEYPEYLVQQEQRGRIVRTPFGRRTGWEQALNDWLAEMAERFGYDTSWLLEVLRLHLYQDVYSNRWVRRRGKPLFSEVYEFVSFTARLWEIPDVDLRAWFRRQLEAHPEQRERLAKVQDLLQLSYPLDPQQRRLGPNKQEIYHLLEQYPTISSLHLALRRRQQAPLPEGGNMPPPETEPPEHESLQAAMGEQTSEPHIEKEQDSAIFTIVSRRFPTSALPPTPSLPDVSSSSTPGFDHATAYRPVHEACQALLRAMEQLTARYGREWLDWESAQTDLAQLRAALTPT